MPKQIKCLTCYWAGRCYERHGCHRYTPIDIDEYDDEYVDSFIESERSEFRKDWMEYAEEMLNEMFF